MGSLIAVPIVLGISYSIYKIIELFVKRRERLLLVEKISEKIDGNFNKNGSFKFNIDYESKGSFTALRWSLLLLGIGFGLFAATMIDLSIVTSAMYDEDSYRIENLINTVYGALPCLFGGLGLLVAYLIEIKNNKLNKKEE